MFPIKETWKNKLKALYPKDEEECILKLVDKLYTKSFLEIHKKTNMASEVGLDLKIAIDPKQLSMIRSKSYNILSCIKCYHNTFHCS
jgi:hypothetical protein